VSESAHGESKVAVIAAVIGNLAIAVIKFIAAAMTGSSAMIAEGIHSLVDTGNGGLVLLGMKRSGLAPDESHQFGHGKELYFWTLIVAISIFGIGGGMSVYEGIIHIAHPASLENPLPSYIVLAISLLVEGSSFAIAMRQFSAARGDVPPFVFIREAKDPSLFTVVFEDSAAMLGLVVAFLGVFLGHLLHNPYFDGAASVVIGLILMVVAWALASESKGLLIGEGVEPEVLAAMKALVKADDTVERVGDIRTMYLGPSDLLVNLDVRFVDGTDAPTMHKAIERIEGSLRRLSPEVNRVYIESAALLEVAEKPAERDEGE
jgi:cation diffusion facilitator family transporter